MPNSSEIRQPFRIITHWQVSSSPLVPNRDLRRIHFAPRAGPADAGTGRRAASRFPLWVITDIAACPKDVRFIPNGGHSAIDPNLLRQEVTWRGHNQPGNIVVNVSKRRLCLVEGNGRAMRYAVGVGRAGGRNSEPGLTTRLRICCCTRRFR
jgi:lipoprotein-anchoring transpeptidase ErfK/SrfK